MRSRRGVVVAAAIALFGALPWHSAVGAAKPKVLVAQSLLPNVPAPAVAAPAQADTGAAGPFCTKVKRAESDRPDLHDGRLVHVLYIVPQGAADEGLDTNGTLACSVLAQNEWIRAQSELEWRWDTALVDTASPSDPNSRIETLDVTFIRSTRAPGALDSGTEVQAELVVRGYTDPSKRYLSYVASGNGAGICGDAFYPLDHHVNEVDGKYAQVYLDSAEGCGARDFGTPATGGGLSEAIAQQELIHNDGMTPLGAPHTCTNAVLPFGHVCTGPLFVLPDVDPEGRDVMFPFVWYPLRDKVLDRGNDDYYDHGLPLAALETSAYLQPANAWGPPLVEPRGDAGSEPSTSPSPDPSVGVGGRSVEASADRRRVAGNGRARIDGLIRGDDGCTAGQTVTLLRRDLERGRDLAPAKGRSGRDGSFTFRVQVRRSTRFVVTAPETQTCAAATSEPVTIRAR